MSTKVKKKEVSVEIDKLTNSIVNVITREIFQTEFQKIGAKEINKKDWLFNWKKELLRKENEVYKMTTVENKNIIQGLVSLSIEDNFIFINLVENAKFNRGSGKIYEGVGGNLFAYACKRSSDIGFGGYVTFQAKTLLVSHYHKTLGAEVLFGQRMVIRKESAEKLIDKYF